MATARKPKKRPKRGPYLDAALICEQTIIEKGDNAISAIRLVNRLTLHDHAPGIGTLISTPLRLLISFKAGEIVGERKFSLYLVTPSRKRREFLKDAILTFHGGDTGAVAIIQIHLPYDGDGTYWIDVTLDHKRCSRVPLTLITNQPPKDT